MGSSGTCGRVLVYILLAPIEVHHPRINKVEKWTYAALKATEHGTPLAHIKGKATPDV